MKQISAITLLFISLLYSCGIQTERIEEKLMDCNNQSFVDGGKQLKELLMDYESNLIKANIISDNTGKSYLKIINQISNGIEPKEKPYYSFGEKLNGIEKNQNSISNTCLQTVLSDSTKYDFKKFLRFQNSLENAIRNARDLRIELLATEFSSTLSEKDFELDFYKMKAFLLFDMLRPYNGINLALPKKNYDLKNAFRIYLNKENKIFINNTEIPLKSLKSKIVKYYKDNESKSVILIKTDEETMYSEYITVQNEIQSALNLVRDNSSNKKFGKKYADLTDKEQKLINEHYPKSIIDE
ncbi:biopolymer transporter ExbD [Tenacibaculum tangerinum]|uniref:Biopolymer transporter ExbD n=1 Tax=Tenacibaculum tangerinum TaxID=3038772 RepID=A0ABY8L4Q0_9FLAO|nr:biopolymer transporter ExbD [Tenacibaculum tangerinum]WGH76402.1 biopolymer transporter ExbD [Tenacibaculum tangerinum]